MVEAGIRSDNCSMPEETNRRLTDTILVLCDECVCQRQSASDGRGRGANHVCRQQIDTPLASLDRLQPPGFWDERGLCPGDDFVVTLHRLANVDEVAALAHLNIIHCIQDARTASGLSSFCFAGSGAAGDCGG